MFSRKKDASPPSSQMRRWIMLGIATTGLLSPLSHGTSPKEIEQLIANGDYHIAVDLLQQQLEEQPQNSDLLILAGQLELSVGNYKKGVTLLNYANKIVPDDARAHYQLGAAHLRYGAYQLADTHLSKALLLSPHDKKIKSLQFLALIKNDTPSIPPEEKLALYPLRTEFPETYFIHAFWHFSQGNIDKAEYFVSAVSDIISLNDMVWYQRWLNSAGWSVPKPAAGL